MTPLFGTPAFPPAIQGVSFGPWCKEEHRRLAQVLHSDSSLTTDISSNTSPHTSTHWLQRQQVLSYIRTFPSLPDILSDLTDLENMLLQTDPPTHVVSQLYYLLHMVSNPDLPPYTLAWKEDLGHSISPVDLQKCFILTHKTSLASKAQEKGFKLLTHWYRCPSTLQWINPALPDTCWRCLSSKGTLLDIWWECPPVRRFWQKILDLYCRLMATSITPPPEVTLLSMILGPLKSIKKDVLRHFLAAARTVLPRHWKSTNMPSLGEWAIEVDRINSLERMLSQEMGKEE